MELELAAARAEAKVLRDLARAEREAECFGAGCCPYMVGVWNCGARCCGFFWALAILAGFLTALVFLFLSMYMPGKTAYWAQPFVTVGFLLLALTLSICCGTCFCMICTGRGRKTDIAAAPRPLPIH